MPMVMGAETWCVPCRATIRLAMQSGTLVPAARKVMPMMTSGIPKVYPMTVTCRKKGETVLILGFFLNISTAVTNYENPEYDFILKTPFDVFSCLIGIYCFQKRRK